MLPTHKAFICGWNLRVPKSFPSSPLPEIPTLSLKMPSRPLSCVL
jgi:hypothetical protein